MLQPPKVDRRTAEDLASQVRSSLKERSEAGELATALIKVFARFGEIIIERLNKAPQKNFLAFLDLLGISSLPPQAAQVPLTFSMSAENVGHAIVPARTQVAASPAQGEQQQVIFETAYELEVVSARLESLLAKNSSRDQYTIFNSVLAPAATAMPPIGASGGAAVADAGTEPRAGGEARLIPHILFIGIATYSHWPTVSQLCLRFNLEEDVPILRDSRIVRWEICAPSLPASPPKPPAQTPSAQVADPSIAGIQLIPVRDDTDNLTKSGEVVFLNIPEIPSLTLDGTATHWLSCRLLTPITSEHGPSVATLRHGHLPRVKKLAIEITLERSGRAIDQAFANNLKVDASKDFFPFGEKPKFGDTLYLANELVFSNPDAFITLQITLTNPASGGADLPLPPTAAHGTKLLWEFWDGKAWVELGTAELGGRRVRIAQEPTERSIATQFSDTTQTFSESGTVSFRFSKPPRECVVNGQKNFWIRVRMIGGDYGRDARYEHDPARGTPVVIPATFAPPSIHSIKVDYAVKKESPPEALVTYNDFSYTWIRPDASSFQPFVPAHKDEGLYFGFSAANARANAAREPSRPPGNQVSEGRGAFSNRSMSLYVALAGGDAQTGEDTQTRTPAVWEYWNGSAWIKLTARDDTQGLQRSGLLRFLAPSDYMPRKEFGLERYWLRMSQTKPGFESHLHRVLLNTTIAAQVISITNEILGSSNGKPLQKFRVTRAPVLEGQQLEIRELAMPPLQEQLQIRKDEGDDAIRKVKNASGKAEDIWVSWHKVSNFYGSTARDRHYVLDRLSGEVGFGDGVNGLIPPVLPNNIRLAKYRSGGGAAGNKPAGTVTQLKSAVPYIEKVINWEPASGGADAEPETALLDRGPRILRHNGRAVTGEDFEDLALLASPGVARARCIPVHDLRQHPHATQRRPGVVSIVIVPRSADPRPMPSLDLLNHVRGFLNNHSTPTVELVLRGPVYVTVDVEAEIAVQSIDAAPEVEHAVTLALQRYLHPLTGGPDGFGWNFGRKPHRSDLFALLEHISGVSHVRSLELRTNGEPAAAGQISWWLICCGNTRITMVLEE